MIVNQTNALTVAAIFAALSDERFSMRTPVAIVKTGNNDAVTEASVLDIAAEMGLEFKRRIRDGATLVERPTSVTAQEASALAERARTLAANGGEEFTLNFADLAGDIEGGDATGDIDPEDGV